MIGELLDLMLDVKRDNPIEWQNRALKECNGNCRKGAIDVWCPRHGSK